MRTYFAYIRVSTVRQGEKGSSLTEQRDAILRYAQKHDLRIGDWFEEQETAAKVGRTVFRRMLTRLKRGGAHGLILHKIDRGARNLADWAEIGALMDIGVDIHLAHEAIDMSSRGGRLSADIQAVVASDYIRNLRQEVKKGIYGRLKQGLYPFNAPAGYQNNGGGQVKTIDPVQGPLVREAFELYANGNYALRALLPHMTSRGLRNSANKPFSLAAFAHFLASPFYYGLLTIKGETQMGVHTPIISKQLFDRARARAEGRLTARTRSTPKIEYAFRRLLTCKVCAHSLYAERHKGIAYYRCHSLQCRGTSIRETSLVQMIHEPLSYFSMTPALCRIMADMFVAHTVGHGDRVQESVKRIKLRIGQIDAKHEKLTDAFIEGGLDKADYHNRRMSLQNERIFLSQEMQNTQDTGQGDKRQQKFLELICALPDICFSTNPREIRDFAKTAISNIKIEKKTIEIQWSNALAMLIDLSGVLRGGAEHDEPLKRRQSVTIGGAEHDGPLKQRQSVTIGGAEHDEPLKRRQSFTALDEPLRSALSANGDVLIRAIRLFDALDEWTPGITNDNAESVVD